MKKQRLYLPCRIEKTIHFDLSVESLYCDDKNLLLTLKASDSQWFEGSDDFSDFQIPWSAVLKGIKAVSAGEPENSKLVAQRLRKMADTLDPQ